MYTLHKLALLLFFLLSFWACLIAKRPFKPIIEPQITQSENYFPFTENKGQWHSNVIYQVDLPLGKLYLEQNCLTYCFLNTLPHAHGLKEEEHYHNYIAHRLKAHVYKVHFVNSNYKPQLIPQYISPDYANYFKGDKAVSGVYSYKSVCYKNLYSGIDLEFYTQREGIKYDFIIQPGVNPREIQLRYEGVTNLFLHKGKLIIRTSINEIQESIPKAYQIIDGKQKIIPCEYVLQEGNLVSFHFPKGYNSQFPLIIDPVLVFGTLTGSRTDNWGFTATYDDEGNFYCGGIAYSWGYPTSTGAFQVDFAGGVQYPSEQSLWYDSDIAIIKYNPSGTTRIWATYLGGRDNEQPHSLIVNSSNELFILGTTRSNDFPTTSTAYDRTHNGGIDIIVTRLNANATQLLGSTYVGGNNNDGINIRGESSNPLYKFYADDSRGEIILDKQGNCVIASSTNSANFPTFNAVQTTLRGNQDAVVFKMNATLSTMQWSTYLGGNRIDAGYSLKIDSNGDVYVTGGTNSVLDLPVSSDAWRSSYVGGTADGFIFHLRGTGGRILRGTYVGTTAYDQTYMIDLDANNNVYVVGQTEGNYPIQNVGYSVARGSQFITKFDPALRNIIFSTRFGSGRSTPDITISAFLVDVCENIYVSGWGGLTRENNLQYGSTLGLPITPDAFQQTTDGRDFYLIVLRKDAASLFYATYFGGGRSEEHVDGGTSRFDKRGVVYQSVCAGCGRNNDFPTTPGAWSRTNNSDNCNNGAFKLRVDLLEAALAEFTPSVYSGCSPLTVSFTNRSTGAISYRWDFGDGNTSTATNPTHTFRTPGRYVVRLTAENPNLCNRSDFTEKIIEVIPGPEPPVAADIRVCERGPAVFTVTVNDQQPVEVGLFTQPSGSTAFSTDATPPYLLNTPSFTTTTTYYIATTRGGCSSARIPVVATVVLPPPFPQIQEPKSCGAGVLTFTLTFTGGTSNLQVALYSTSVGGSPLQIAASAPYLLSTPFITTTTQFFFEVRNDVCTTSRISARANIITPPAAPSASDIALCRAGVVTFTARHGTPPGSEIILYDAPTGGQVIGRSTATPALLATPFLTATTTFYLEAINDICTSRRAPVIVT
ncbi:MAG: PKD domain-containing protein, partial [Bacteroidia bacterium]|nr:PKD domain-containing protein [Bacteroidia bacterium]